MGNIQNKKRFKGAPSLTDSIMVSVNKKDVRIPLSTLESLFTDTGRPYDVYTATISQSGTNPPAADFVSQNEIGTITYYYDNAGLYRIGSSAFGLLTDNKVQVIVGSGNQNNASKSLDAYVALAPVGRDPLTLNCEIALETCNNATPTNGLIYRAFIEIRVYHD